MFTRRLAFEVGCVIAIGVAVALVFGEPFGTKNQQTYLLDGLGLAHPELFRNDWFVTQNHHYHAAFAYLTAPLFAVDAGGWVAIAVAHIIVTVATFVAIYGLVARAMDRGRLVVFAGIVGLVMLGGGRALGGSYLYAGYLQPSSLATLGWLLAMNAWIRDRHGYAGLALAAGGLFHLNYAVLGLGVFAMCEIAARGFSARRLAMLLAPSLVVIAVFVPALVASARSSESELANRVLVHVVFPGHFDPARVRLGLCSLVGWCALAFALRPRDSRLFWFAIVTCGSCIVSVVVVSVPAFVGLAKLFVWRIAPLGILATQILLFTGVRDIARGARSPLSGRQSVLLFGGAAAVVVGAFIQRLTLSTAVITCVMVVIGAAIAARSVRVVTALCVALCVVAVSTTRERWCAVFDSNDPGVFRWARTTTPRDATFLIPPYYGEFRLLARRAVIVDDKSPPMYSDELVAWYRRLCAAVDATTLTSVVDAERRWDALPAERLVAIAQAFDADYIVLDKLRNASRLALPVAYEDAGTIVYARRAASTSATASPAP